MNKIFDFDSPVMKFLSRMGDLMILNFVVLLCCLPIITIGASVTAMHYVMLKLVRGEEGYILKDYFKSFKLNFRQATVIWLIMLVFIAVFVGDYIIFHFSVIEFPKVLIILVLAIALLLFMLSTYIFPVLSRFDNTIKNTIKNGCIMSLLAIPKAILMVLLTISPIIILWFIPQAAVLVFIFGISLPAYLSAMLYSGTFKRFEPEVEEAGEEEVFHVVFDGDEERAE